MIKRELAKDPQLATESWDRFLPQFRKKHLKTSEKTAKKNEKLREKNEARAAAGLEPIGALQRPEKKVYTPFPPPQQPRKVHPRIVVPYNSSFVDFPMQVDLQLESGEYFLKAKEKEARDAQRRKEKASFCLDASSCTNYVDCHFSKRKSPRNVGQNVQRPLLHLPRPLSQLWKSVEGVNVRRREKRKEMVGMKRRNARRKNGKPRVKTCLDFVHCMPISSFSSYHSFFVSFNWLVQM